MMTKRTFVQATVALSVTVSTSIPFQAMASKLSPKQLGEYAVLGFSERMMKQRTHLPFFGISAEAACRIIEQYGVRDDVSGVTYIKVTTYRAPNIYKDGERTIQVIGGGMSPRFAAMVTCLCSDGRVTDVVKNKLDGMRDIEHVARFIPAAVHTTQTKTLMIRTGLMGSAGPSVEPMA